MSSVIRAESWPRAIWTCLIEQPEAISTEAKKWLDRTEARCQRFGWSVSSARPPNRTCGFRRIRLSTGSCHAGVLTVVAHGVTLRICPR